MRVSRFALLTSAAALLGLAVAVWADRPGAWAESPALAGPAKKKKKRKKKLRPVKVRRIRPKHRKTFVPLDAQITVRFSRAVDPETISAQTVKLRALSGNDLDWSSEMSKGNKLLTLTPGSYFDPGRDYEVEIGFGVLSERGGELKKEARSIFYTDATVPPFQFIRPQQFEPVATSMFEGRAKHSATLLRDGRVLLAGGLRDYVAVTDTADLYVPAEDRFRVVPSTLATPRAAHVGLEFGGGAMLVGGWDGTDASDAVDVYDPFDGQFRAAPSLLAKRDFVSAVTLHDGRVLVVGGLEYEGSGARYHKTAEIYDASTGGWRFTADTPRNPRAGHAMTVLDDGRVLITGGLAPGDPAGPVSELFDPKTETFEETPAPALGHRQLHTSTLLGSGRVLIADGNNGKTELFDPTLDRFLDAGGSSFARRTESTATLLPGDRVLLLGGFARVNNGTLILDSMDLYIANTGGGLGRVVHVSVVLDEPRAGHTATTLGDGRTLIAGGYGSTSEESLSSALLFTPD